MMDQTEASEIEADERGNEDVKDIIPQIFIDSKVLQESIEASLHRNNKKEHKLYEVNGTIFEVTDLASELFKGDDIKEFEVKEVKEHRNFDEDTVKDSTDSYPVDNEKEIEKLMDLYLGGSGVGNSNHAQIQKTPYGIIVNSNVLLTVNAWNTIMDDEDTYCVVCGTQLKADDIFDHIATDGHKITLDGNQPLEEFDDVVRQINDKYHCAICNVMFDINDAEHLESQSHGQKMLASINKVSDIMNDFNMYLGSSDSISKDRDNQSKARVKDSIYFNVNDTAVENSDGMDDEYFYDAFEESSCNYGYSNSDQDNIDSDDTMNESIEKLQYSYADVAKKAKMTTPDFVEIKIGDKVAKVFFYYWHMIVIQKKNNRYYCMACNGLVGPIRYKSEHCATVSHVENLMKCTIVGYFLDYVVRKVTDKFYHCGHCNNLILPDQMETHIETYNKKGVPPKMCWVENNEIANTKTERAASASPRTADTFNKTEDSDRAIKTAPIADENVQRNNDNQTQLPSCSTRIEDDLKFIDRNDKNVIDIQNAATDYINNTSGTHRPGLNAPVNTNIIPTEGDTVEIVVFGRVFWVSLLSFHFIHKQTNDYHCWLCRVSCSNGLIWHHIFNDLKHKRGMMQAPFCPQYGFNLIRNAQYVMQCVLCNAYMKFDPVWHLREPMHQFLLNRALGTPYLGIPIVHPNAMPTLLRDNETSINTPLSDVQTDKNKQNDTINDQLGRPTDMNDNKNHITSDNDNKQLNDQFANGNKKDKVNKSNQIIDQRINNCDNAIYKNSNESKSEVNRDKSNKKDYKTYTNVDQTINRDDIKVDSKIVSDKKVNDIKTLLDGRIKNDTDIEGKLDNTTEEQESNREFDVEKFVYVKVKNTYAKITATSYNTLVPTGNGSRYCFVCSKEVMFEELCAHVNSNAHQKNILDIKFLARPQKHFLRQVSTLYHCALCNVLILKKFLQDHLIWTVHSENLSRKITKNVRRNEIKAGTNELSCQTQDEVSASATDKENPWTMLCNIKFERHGDIVKKKQIIKINDIAMKVSWDAYHGIIRSKNGNKCLICQMEFKSYELASHVEMSRHVDTLVNGFELKLAPDLIRKINVEMMHCLTCNIRIYNTTHVMNSHLNGEKHQRLYNEAIINDISNIDCLQTDILTLTS